MAKAKFYLSLRFSPLYKEQASRQCLFESFGSTQAPTVNSCDP